MAGKKKRSPEAVLLEMQREVIFRRANAVRIETGPAGVAITFEANGKTESYLTLDAEAGEALTALIKKEAGDAKRIETRLPEGTLHFEVTDDVAALVLTRAAAPEKPAAPPAAAPPPEAAVLEAEPEEALPAPPPEESADSAVVGLANQLLLDGLRLGATRLHIDPAKNPPLTWEGVNEPPVSIEPAVAATVLRRILMMAAMAYTRKTESVITMALPSGERAPMRVTRRAANDREPITIDLVAGAAPAAAAPVAAAAKRAFPGVAIGEVRSSVREDVDDGWGKVESEVVLDARFATGLKGLEGFTHAIVVFWMDRSTFDTPDLVRRPRGREDLPPTGIFAQRAKHRPNPIGVTAVKIEGVDAAKGVLKVQGLDAIDGTPVLDVKPYVPAFDRPEHARVPGWMDTIMKGYF